MAEQICTRCVMDSSDPGIEFDENGVCFVQLKDGKKTVAWDFVYIPSEEWKKNLKQALIAYAADNTKWDGVKNAFVDGWKTEKAASE